MTTVERHMLGLAFITLANISAAFAALKTFEARLWAEAQKTHIEAPTQQQKRHPYDPQNVFQLASSSTCCNSTPGHVLTLDRAKLLSE